MRLGSRLRKESCDLPQPEGDSAECNEDVAQLFSFIVKPLLAPLLAHLAGLPQRISA